MQKYRVGISYEESGVLDIYANSKEEAEAKVEALLDEDGYPANADTKNREFYVTNVEEL